MTIDPQLLIDNPSLLVFTVSSCATLVLFCLKVAFRL